MSWGRTACLALVMGLLVGGPSRGDTPFIKETLAKPIIGPRQAMADVQAYVTSRVPRMPSVKSAEEWSRTVEQLRADVAENVLFRGAAASWRDANARVEWLDTIEGGPGYHIRKLRLEALPGLWVPALLYEPTVLNGKVPVVLNVNGHDGKGKAADYKQVRCINLAKRGMIALNLEWFGMGQLRTDGFQHGLINAIDLCGTSGIATHFLAMKRGLDVLLAHEHADPSRVGVTGLSGGGWQTVFISGLDPRVTLTDPVAGYSSFLTRAQHFSDLGDSEQTPCDLATVVDYTHLTAMMAPKPTLLTFNAKDNCCFASPHALPPLVDAVAPIFALFGVPGNFRAHVNFDPGDHNYLLDNRQALYQMMADHWSTFGFVINPKEVPSDSEIQSAEALNVPLPATNLDFHQLALGLARELPRASESPTTENRSAWQADRRERLRRIVRPFEGDVKATEIGKEEHDGTRATFWKLRVAETWTVPVVELVRESPDRTVIVLCDQGRTDCAGPIEGLVNSGARVLALDPFYFGESRMAEKDYLWALLLSSVGERPLGTQAGQVVSAAAWAKSRFGGSPIEVVSIGPRTSVIGLVAAALAPETIDGAELNRPLGSLKQLLEENRVYTHAPELFCFGLLESFDVKQLAALVAPRPVRLVDPDERAKAELGDRPDRAP